MSRVLITLYFLWVNNMHRYAKRMIICCGTIFLAWCSGTTSLNVQVQDFSFNIPPSFQSISSQSLDNAQIAHSILAARKDGNANIILTESSLPSNVSIKNFTDSASKRTSQEMIWYGNASITSKSFMCNGKKQQWYIHSFTQSDIKDIKIITTYYEQYYFARNGSIYILSIAQNTKKSIVDDIITSMRCNSTVK